MSVVVVECVGVIKPPGSSSVSPVEGAFDTLGGMSAYDIHVMLTGLPAERRMQLEWLIANGFCAKTGVPEDGRIHYADGDDDKAWKTRKIMCDNGGTISRNVVISHRWSFLQHFGVADDIGQAILFSPSEREREAFNRSQKAQYPVALVTAVVDAWSEVPALI